MWVGEPRRESPADARRRWRRAALAGVVAGTGALLVGLTAAAVTHDDATLLCAAIGLAVGLGVVVVGRPAYRRRAHRRELTSGALYAAAASVRDLQATMSLPGLGDAVRYAHFPWWAGAEQGLDAVSGVLWIFPRCRSDEVRWEPGYLARRRGVGAICLPRDRIDRAEVDVRAAALRFDLHSGGSLFLSVSEPARLERALHDSGII